MYLGLCYFSGEGVKPSLSKAIAIWSNAADFGNREARKYLGILYANGTGVKKDLEQAKKLFYLAAQQGDEESKKYLEQLRLDTSVPMQIKK